MSLLTTSSSSPPPPPRPPGANLPPGRGGERGSSSLLSSATGSTSTSFIDVSQLPSVKKGMSSSEESTKRKKTCRFIEEAGRVLKLPRVAISTAMVFFHRFYAKHAFQDHDRFEVAVASLVLAAKTEEAPKKLNSVIQECYKLKTRAMQAGRLSQQQRNNDASGGGGGTGTPGASGGGNASGSNTPSLSPVPPSKEDAATGGGGQLSSGYLDPKGEEFIKMKERILLLERIILHTIGFELSIDHPYKFFVDQIKKLIRSRQLRYVKVPGNVAKKSNSEITAKMMNELVQYSMSAANDSYQTSLCLQYGPKQIATACVYLACAFSNVEPVSGDWKSTLFGGGPDNDGNSNDRNANNNENEQIEALASVCVQIVDLIADKRQSDGDAVRKIKKALEVLKSRSSSGGGRGTSAVSGSRSPPPPPPKSEPVPKRPRSDP